MKRPKSNKTVVTVKTGTVEEFFDRAKKAMRALDKKGPLTPSHTLVFTDSIEMLHFLSEKKCSSLMLSVSSQAQSQTLLE